MAEAQATEHATELQELRDTAAAERATEVSRLREQLAETTDQAAAITAELAGVGGDRAR